MERTLVGEIVEKDGMLCLQTSPNAWYPLAGSSGVATAFVEAFGPAVPRDKGKRVFNVGGVLQMENQTQYEARMAQSTAPIVEPTHEAKMTVLREFGELQGECARKAASYAAQDRPDLAKRFERASYAAVNARMFIQAALMAEREA